MGQETSRTRDPEAVRSAVLDAAMTLFADRGFADTSIRDISQASGVSHPLILHHFGSKEDLYSAVKRRVVEGYAKRFPSAARSTNRPINVRAEMKRLLTYLGENEQALRLCARTRLDGDYQVWPGEPDLLDLIRRRIEVAQRRHLVREDLNPTLLSLMIIGLVFFWLDNRKHFTQRFGDLPADEEYLRTAVSLVEQGMMSRGLPAEPSEAVKEEDSPQDAEA